MRYSFTSRIRYSEIGENKKLTLPALVNYFQDCSNFQSEEAGIGIDWLTRHKKLWVLAAWRIHINRYPDMGEDTVISTWAYGFKAFRGLRNFTMESKDGELLAYANSDWAYIDIETGRPERVTQEVVDQYGLSEPIQADFGSRKIVVPKENGRRFEAFPVMEYHLDTNHHMNNGQYIQLAEGYLPTGFEVKKMRAEYKQQAFPGDVMKPELYDIPDGYVIVFNNKDDKPYFVAELKK